MLPPIVRLLLTLIVGIAIGSSGSYFYVKKVYENELLTIQSKIKIKDHKVVEKITNKTNKILKEVRKENEKDKPFDCGDAKLPSDRLQRLQREIDRARQRANPSLPNIIIEKASNL